MVYTWCSDCTESSNEYLGVSINGGTPVHHPFVKSPFLSIHNWGVPAMAREPPIFCQSLRASFVKGHAPAPSAPKPGAFVRIVSPRGAWRHAENTAPGDQNLLVLMGVAGMTIFIVTIGSFSHWRSEAPVRIGWSGWVRANIRHFDEFLCPSHFHQGTTLKISAFT